MKFTLYFFVAFFVAIIPLQGAFAYDKELTTLAANMAIKIEESGKKNIAVVDFTDLQGNITELGRFIAEELSVDLLNTNKQFEVVDRTHLKSILQENKLTLSGIIDSKTASKIGQLAGVDTIMTGSVVQLDDSIRVSVKILSVDTAKIIGASSINIPRSKAIDSLLNKNITATSGTGTFATNTNFQEQTLESNGFSITLKGYKKTKSNIVFNFLVTNITDNTIGLSIGNAPNWGYPTCIYDDQGNKYEPVRMKFGSDEKSYDQVYQNIPSNMPLKASIEFGALSQEAKSFTLQVGGMYYANLYDANSRTLVNTLFKNIQVY